MSSKPNARSVFQVHLSTCIILMISGGGILWANLMPPRVFGFENTGSADDSQPKAIGYWGYCGWPFYKTNELYFREPVDSVAQLQEGLDSMIADGLVYKHYSAGRFYSWTYVFSNVGAGIVILAGIGFVCELIIRKRVQLHKKT